MTVHLDRPKVVGFGYGEKALSFNALWNENPETAFSLSGIRLMRGRLKAPSIKIGTNYFQVALLSSHFSRALYDALSQQDWDLEEAGGLKERSEALENFNMLPERIDRQFPTFRERLNASR